MADIVTVTKRALQPLNSRRPWVDAGMIERTRGTAHLGAAVRLVGPRGEFLAWGLWSGEPRFPIRVISWEPDTTLDPSFFHAAAAAAVQRRVGLPLTPETDAVRLIFGEADGLPGLVADRYGEYAVLTREGRFLDPYLIAIASGLTESASLAGVLLRDDAGNRVLAGVAPPETLTIREGELRFEIDPHEGQKTGWFCDQRQNRLRVTAYAGGADVLDVFCYTGGFSVAALRSGASSARLLDSSAAALALAQRNLTLNDCPEAATPERCDAMDRLRSLAKEGLSFDLVILDPPKLQPPHGKADRAEAAYLSLQGLAMKLVRPGGRLATFSCSGAMSRARFDGVVAKAAGARPCRVLERLAQPPDHPILLSHPKSEYLTGLIVELG